MFLKLNIQFLKREVWQAYKSFHLTVPCSPSSQCKPSQAQHCASSICHPQPPGHPFALHLAWEQTPPLSSSLPSQKPCFSLIMFFWVPGLNISYLSIVCHCSFHSVLDLSFAKGGIQGLVGFSGVHKHCPQNALQPHGLLPLPPGAVPRTALRDLLRWDSGAQQHR